MITSELKKKIDWLHKQVGNNEWSGELITREEGTINDLDDWKITAEDLFLADVGTPGYTEYEVGKGGFKASDIIELHETFPGLETGEQKVHHVHSHHSMSSFFSGTDWDNLHDRALVSNYFLMLIVNFAEDYKAKVAFRAKKEGGGSTTLSFTNNFDNFQPLKLKGKDDNEVLVVMDCVIEIQSTIEEPLGIKARYEKVKDGIEKEKEAKKKEWKPKEQGKLPFKEYNNSVWDTEYGGWGAPEDRYNGPVDDYEYDSGVWKKKGTKKKISDMSQKEWEQWEQEEEAKRIFHKDQENKYELKHAKALLNSVITNTYADDDFSDCIDIIEKIDKTIKSQDKLFDYMVDFQHNLQDHYDILFPRNEETAYVKLMEKIIEYLSPYKYIRLVKEMLEAAQDEIRMVIEEPSLPRTF